MYIEFIVLSLIAHVLGDYYLQDDEMSKLKKERLKGVLKHSAFYSIPFLLIFFLFKKSCELILLLILLCLLHLAIDMIKYCAYKIFLKVCNTNDKKQEVKKYIKPWSVYVFDQVLHVLSIIVLVSCFPKDIFYPIGLFNNLYDVLKIEALFALKWALLVLCMYKPANITFRILFSECKPKGMLINRSNNNNTVNNGAIIGFLERIIIALFLYSNQYSAIGFILTAKSIARYNKISDDAEFAEYYLIGTLFSTLFVVVIFNFIF